MTAQRTARVDRTVRRKKTFIMWSHPNASPWANVPYASSMPAMKAATSGFHEVEANDFEELEYETVAKEIIRRYSR
ncbi:hypothetical protein UVI_02001050 [Ustilaginoidea virens]|uniref:ADF-H domain-containing protein n=1 Tax=Ustilaginoidea virens TaxID=1159556 RepID=A0A1B5KUT8_USTVR|nr:hypothetical protein UVI_02001050 [Ustilaginoidea virens]